MRFVWSSGTHAGRRRERNEDAVYPEEDGRCSEALLVAVADGLGGHNDGEIASRVAIDSAVATAGSPWERVKAANTAILDRIFEEPSLAGMGTTLTLARLDPAGSVTLGHVGDSRAYLLRGRRLTRLTVDHTYVQAAIEAGRLTEHQARRHRERSHLIRALGFGQKLAIDIGHTLLEVDDRLMLCSDGLSSILSDRQIADVLGIGSPSDAVWGLIEAANWAGGGDNISVVVVLVTGDDEA